MQVEDKFIKFWSKLAERGDVTDLARLTKLDISTVSRILKGEQKKTSTATVLVINNFYKKRAKERNKASVITHDPD